MALISISWEFVRNAHPQVLLSKKLWVQTFGLYMTASNYDNFLRTTMNILRYVPYTFSLFLPRNPLHSGLYAQLSSQLGRGPFYFSLSSFSPKEIYPHSSGLNPNIFKVIYATYTFLRVPDSSGSSCLFGIPI